MRFNLCLSSPCQPWYFLQVSLRCNIFGYIWRLRRHGPFFVRNNPWWIFYHWQVKFVASFAHLLHRFCSKNADFRFRSMISCLQMAVGEIGVFPSMVDAAPGIANVFFVTFLFIVVIWIHNSACRFFFCFCDDVFFPQVFVLFNVLLAIIVDAYQSAANDSRETISIAQDAVLALKRLNYQISAYSGRPTVPSHRLAYIVSAMLKQARQQPNHSSSVADKVTFGNRCIRAKLKSASPILRMHVASILQVPFSIIPT